VALWLQRRNEDVATSQRSATRETPTRKTIIPVA
jgi:hypothetical protein